MNDTNKVAIPILQDKDGNYLLITRTEYPEHFGEWGPIAGHVKENETIGQALIRESKEELNLDVKPLEQKAVIPQDIAGDTGYWWICQIVGGTIKTNAEISEYRYFSLEEIKSLKLWPATKKFFEEYIWKA